MNIQIIQKINMGIKPQDAVEQVAWNQVSDYYMAAAAGATLAARGAAWRAFPGRRRRPGRAKSVPFRRASAVDLRGVRRDFVTHISGTSNENGVVNLHNKSCRFR